MTQEMCPCGKIAYESHNMAHKAMRAIAQHDSTRCRVYRCKEYGRWHWGHQTLRKRKSRRGGRR